MQYQIEEADCMLAKARRTIDAARAALEARPDDPRLGDVAARLERITAEVGRVERRAAKATPQGRTEACPGSR